MTDIKKHPVCLVRCYKDGHRSYFILFLTYAIMDKSPLLYMNELYMPIDEITFNMMVNTMRLEQTSTKSSTDFEIIEVFS